jgi:hypothetical protein
LRQRAEHRGSTGRAGGKTQKVTTILRGHLVSSRGRGKLQRKNRGPLASVRHASSGSAQRLLRVVHDG